jgi:uncharacterized protein YjbI with pentapeptide repeats
MSDPQHVSILMQGVDAWNEGRETNLEVTPNLKRAGLEGFDLSGANLQAAIRLKTQLVGTLVCLYQLI